ncbi:hypothetical protein EJ08DRAFT_622773 [Tothia fuscella]|uniref:Xylanolytic transcriptional activator regulatory domain-containing protein n=1 Tax=Tothia fuscella TaxID=1048955 RepID=A0A9P4NDN4_9PEZI|nr:hypothetical protein EJ08DRAFT_622773 [Tothia fuscella]
MRLPIPTTPIPSYIQSLLGDSTQVRETAAMFFSSVHNYMPVVSKKLFYDRLLNPLQEPRADVALLCLCMRLSIWSQTSNETNPQSDVYLTAKRYVVELEASGVLTLALMQACLLLSIYEIGHGIYPAAFMTVGSCAAYGFALALDSTGTVFSEQFTWIEKEERRRVWWAVIILERIRSLGWPGRPLQTPDPVNTDLLPADDLLWDQGFITPNHTVELVDVTNVHFGRFARLAIATHLLSRVYRHIADTFPNTIVQHHEAMQLDRTVNALKHLCELDAQRTAMRYCNPVAICSSTLQILHNHYITTKPGVSIISEYHDHSWSALKALSYNISEIAQTFLQNVPAALSEVSPMVLHSTYQAASTLIHVNRKEPDEASLAASQVLKLALKIKDMRWKAEGEYLHILEARDIMYDL